LTGSLKSLADIHFSMFLGAFNFTHYVKPFHLPTFGGKWNTKCVCSPFHMIFAGALLRVGDCDIDASAAAAFYSTTGNGTAGYSQLSFPSVNSSEQEEVLPPAHCTALGSHFLIWNAPYLSVWELLYLNGDGKTVTISKMKAQDLIWVCSFFRW
jgi:hypothetical protein